MNTESHQLREWRTWFTQVPPSVGQARSEARAVLLGWGCRAEAADAVVLVVSELASNVVRHARVPGRFFEVRLENLGDVCEVEVSDTCDAHPRLSAPGAKAESGRGLMLVAALAEKWGSRDRTTGKTVWARVPLTT